MMEEIIIKLKALLEKKISLLNENFNDLENSNVEQICYNINSFNLLYKNTGLIDLELLSSFYNCSFNFNINFPITQ